MKTELPASPTTTSALCYRVRELCHHAGHVGLGRGQRWGPQEPNPSRLSCLYFYKLCISPAFSGTAPPLPYQHISGHYSTPPCSAYQR